MGLRLPEVAGRLGFASVPRPLQLAVYLLLSGTVIYLYRLLVVEGFMEELLGVKIEEELMTLAAAALLILLSVPIARLLGVSSGIVEILMGVGLAFAGAHVGDALLVISGIGANMLLFMAGSEIDVDLLKRVLLASAAAAALVIVPSAAVGLLMAEYYGLSQSATILVIAAFSATSVALTYSLLGGTRLLRSRAGQLALAAAMLADILGMILINVATAAVDPRLLLYGAVILAAIALQPVLPRLHGGPFEAEIRLVIMMLIVLGAVSEVLGVHSVLTSFIMGLVVAETVRSRRELREKLEGLATGFFTPFFFIVSGMSIDPEALTATLLEAVVIGAALTLVKAALGYAYFTRILGLRRRVALMLSASITPLLTVTIIAAGIGLQLGLIGQELYSILMGVVITSGFLASALMILARRL